MDVTAPISIENLKAYFVDKDIKYNIIYKDSSLKGSKLLTYLSNLEIPCNIDFKGCSDEDIYSLLEDYLNSKLLVNIESLEFLTIFMLKQHKGLIDKKDFIFLDKNKEVLDSWVSKLDSMTLYNMKIVSNDAFDQFLNSFEKDETEDTSGVNFVSLFKRTDMFSLYEKIDVKNLKHYTKYFNEYMFKGKNLYTFWANENNPLFLLTFSIAEGIVKSDTYNEALKEDLKQLQETVK
jgi:hypothetical protein